MRVESIAQKQERIQNVRRILDRVKLQHYKSTKPDKSE